MLFPFFIFWFFPHTAFSFRKRHVARTALINFLCFIYSCDCIRNLNKRPCVLAAIFFFHIDSHVSCSSGALSMASRRFSSQWQLYLISLPTHQPLMHPTTSRIKSKFLGLRCLVLAKTLKFLLLNPNWVGDREENRYTPSWGMSGWNGGTGVLGSHMGALGALCLSCLGQCFLFVVFPGIFCWQPWILFQMWGKKQPFFRRLCVANIFSSFHFKIKGSNIGELNITLLHLNL